MKDIIAFPFFFCVLLRHRALVVVMSVEFAHFPRPQLATTCEYDSRENIEVTPIYLPLSLCVPPI